MGKIPVLEAFRVFCRCHKRKKPVATVLDQINTKIATAAARAIADAAAVAADSADTDATTTLVSTLSSKGPAGVLAPDSSSVTIYSAKAGTLITDLIPLAGFVTLSEPAPAPAPSTSPTSAPAGAAS